MRKCNATPYEGEQPYIFISYSHKDSGMVFPVIEYLAKKGYRIWYDNGIHPGTEWQEVIGQHLSKCEVFMSFISSRSMESHNCKKEFNFASMENKKALSVILEPVQLSMALKMQMATIQGIIRYEYPDFESYMAKFLQSDIIRTCLGQPNDDIVVLDETAADAAEETRDEKKAFDWFKSDYSRVEEADITTEDLSPKGTTMEQPIDTDDEDLTVCIDDDDDVTVCIDDEKTEMFRMVFCLTRRGTGEKTDISHSEFVVGRKAKNSQADYMVEDEMKSVSRTHMTFVFEGDKCFLKDNGTANGTLLNGNRLECGKLYPVNEGDEIVMGYEKFTFDVSVEMRKG